ncbi:hypothetical protein [Candidatus Albibeggiatoa sp. nov. NOAA]|uniref:hypothetical protein n=1 Tax=Candidatus Albibeggiatoa sp. nov. NOAA TaxID=3162724 RepID=UPI0032F8E1E6|nr:hypothetical protein [Thiotrichaceae bacterium]
MSCSNLKYELQRLDQAEKKVESKKGMTGTNVAAALFWLLGSAYTYYDVGQTLETIGDRRSHITQLYNEKNCQ